MDIKVDYWFPTPIWITDLDINNDQLKTACLKLKEDNLDGRVLSNMGGWQSNDLYPEQNIAVFRQLVSSLTESINYILENDYCITDRVANVSQYWININKGHNANQVHIHPGAFLSGVYYVSAPEGSGSIHFERDSKEIYAMGCLKIGGKTVVSTMNCEYKPKTGRLLLFPGWLPHSVLPNTTDEERISIAFNAELKTTSFGGLI